MNYFLPALLFLLSLSLLPGCGGDDEPIIIPGTAKTFRDLDVVTGLTFTDADGNQVRTYGTPNENIGNQAALIFPNPTTDRVSVRVTAGAEGIFLLRASCIDNDVPEAPSESLALAIDPFDLARATVASQAIDSTTAGDDGLITLNLEPYDEGFYRVFLQLGQGQYLWQNLFIDRNRDADIFDSLEEKLDSRCSN